ncbi:MAG: hypothetical protein OJF49_001205 [Ktedonobacterales bacterium]|jgi:hypothetical protein|nr:MAG: hypothetical protein OJF49_001205 [Ktedonobacterales bacterium]
MKPRPLPAHISSLLDTFAASPRLVAHLTLVHDVACTLIARLDEIWPSLTYDRDAVRIGTAIHDIGKIQHPEELSAPGNKHEAAGESVLLAHGFPAIDARFARTHGQWETTPNATLADLLVVWADNLWRGKRNESLEAAICQEIVRQTNETQWQAFLALDDIATAITADADARISWQSQQPI